MSNENEVFNGQMRFTYPIDKSYEFTDHTKDYLNLIPGRKLEIAIEEEEKKEAEENAQNDYNDRLIMLDIESDLETAEHVETTNVLPFNVDSDDEDRFGDLGFLYTPPKPKYKLCCHKSIENT